MNVRPDFDFPYFYGSNCTLMRKFMRIPWYYPFAGVVGGFGLLIAGALIPDSAVAIAGIVLLQLSGWVFAARFFFSGCGFFSMALMD